MAPKSGDLTFTFEVSANTDATPLQLPLTLVNPLTGMPNVTPDIDYTIKWNETETKNGPFSYTVPAASTTQTVTAKLQLNAGAITAFTASMWQGIEHLTSVDVGKVTTDYTDYYYDWDTQTNVTNTQVTTFTDGFWGLNAKFQDADGDGSMRQDETFGVTSLDSLFENAVKLQQVPEVFLISAVTMNNMFKNATLFNDPVVKSWNKFYKIPYTDRYGDQYQTQVNSDTYILSAISMFEDASAFDQPILQLLRNDQGIYPDMTNISKNSNLSAEDSHEQGFMGVDTLDNVFLKIHVVKPTDRENFVVNSLTGYKTVYLDENNKVYDYNFSLYRNAGYTTINGNFRNTPFTLDELAVYTSAKKLKKMDLTFPDGATSPFANQTEQQARENVSRIFGYTNMFDSPNEFYTYEIEQGDTKIPMRLVYHENGYFNNPEATDKKVSFIEITRIEVKNKESRAPNLSEPDTLTIVPEYSTENDYKISIDKYGNPFVDSLIEYDMRFNTDISDKPWSNNDSYNYFLRFKSSTDADYSDLAHWFILDIEHEEHKKASLAPFPVSDAKNYNVDNGQNGSWEVFGTSEEDYLGKLLIADDIESMPTYDTSVGKDILRVGILIDGDYSDILTSRREVLDSKKSTLRALQKAYTSHVRPVTVTGKPGGAGLGHVYDETIEDAHITYNFFRGFFSGNRGLTQALGSLTTKTRLIYWQEGLDSVDPTADAYISFLELGSDAIWRQFKNVLIDDTLEPAIYLYTDFINRYAMIKDENDLRTKINAWYTERDLNGVDAANALIAGDPKHFITTQAEVSSLSDLFNGKIGENHPDIRYWDVGSVYNMNGVFRNSTFNNYINTWERTLPVEAGTAKRTGNNKQSSTLKNVEDMSWVFQGNQEFNQPIGNWNIESATTMYLMFAEASKFNQPIGNWNTSSVTDMSFMFRGASEFNQDINTKSVTVNGVEYTAWDTKLVTTMKSMFEQAKKFNHSIQNWNTSNVVTIEKMFKGASSFNKSLSASYKTDNFEFPDNKTIKFKLRLEDTYGDDWQNNKWKNMTNDPNVSRYDPIAKGVTIKDQDGKIVTMTEIEYFSDSRGGGSIEIDNIKIVATDSKTDVVDPATEENDYEGTYVQKTFRGFTGEFTLGIGMQYTISSGDEIWNEMKISLTSLDEDYPFSIVYDGTRSENKDNELLLNDDIIQKRMNAMNDTWNTLNIENMDQVFCQAESFNGNISNWNTSSVKTMNRMLSGFDSLEIDKIQGRGYWTVTENALRSRVANNNYMVLSRTWRGDEVGESNIGNNAFYLALSRFSTWKSDQEQFPFTFSEGGKITFKAKSNTQQDVVMYFGFNEDREGVEIVATYKTNKVTITPTEDTYEITIPPHNTEYYNVLLLLDTYDVMVNITDVIIEYDNKKAIDYIKPMSFDKNIGSWNVGKVRDFRQMFKDNTAFDNSESDLIDGWRFGFQF